MKTQLNSLLTITALALLAPLTATADDKHHKPAATAATAATASTASTAATAATANAAGAASAEMTDGEVRKVDMESGKLTLRHADIKSLDMPAMTMVFVVKDKAMLDKLKTGDKVKFKAINDAGKFTVTEIQPAR